MLTYFSNSLGKARNRYRNFVAEGNFNTPNRNLSGGGLIRSAGGWEAVSRFRKEHIYCIGDERILGDSTFIEQSLKHDILELQRSESLERKGWNLEKLIEEVCLLHSVKEQRLLGKNRDKNVSRAKSVICYWATEVLNISRKEIAARLRLSQSAVSYRAINGCEYCEKENIEFDALFE
ncbi:MAG: hypothetical protein GKR91_11995 [Pseudomonadales bacterium]|nr:hypothetical protein [Pseudomonadales bacterium]